MRWRPRKSEDEKTIIDFVITLNLVGFAGCSSWQDATASVNKPAEPPQISSIKRWIGQAQVAKGNALFQKNCARCHQPDASGTPNWHETVAEGRYRPPPLNGTAHCCHHSLSILRQTVRVGGMPLGGSMPEFADKLNDQQRDDILAWVQSRWSDEICRVWYGRNEQDSNPVNPIDNG